MPPVEQCASEPHVHIDDKGKIHKCFHKCRNLLMSVEFWVGLTLGYPLEHGLWEYVPPFCYITEWMGKLH